nr:hypothetical protein [Micromonospora sp. DSM 115978]
MPETVEPQPSAASEEALAERLRAAREAARESIGRQVDEELADRARDRAGEELIRLLGALAAATTVERDSARYATVEHWRSAATARAALYTAGVGLPLVGPLLAGFPLLALRRAVPLGWGIGHVIGRARGVPNLVEATEDAIAFLAHWTGLLTEADLSSVRIRAKPGGFALDGSSVAYRSFASAVLSLRVGSFVDLADVAGGVNREVPGAVSDSLRPVLGEIQQRLGNLSSGGLSAGYVPVLGMVVGGAVGFWAARTIGDAAQRFYTAKVTHLDGDDVDHSPTA